MSQNTDPSDRLPPGTHLHGYRIGTVLGQPGGFGITYLAYNAHLNQRFAIKEYLPREFAIRVGATNVQAISASTADDFQQGLQRFMEEAKILAQFRHANIVRVFSYIEANGTAYMVMDYEDGQDLEALLHDPATREEAYLLGLLFPLLDGLDKVHATRIIHRDIKPANIFIRDADHTPILLDFGSARYVMGRKTSLITSGYAPMEQYTSDGDQGPWTDIYALGAVLYRAISGKKPPRALDRVQAKLDGQRDPLRPAVVVGRDRYSLPFLRAIDHALAVIGTDRPQNLRDWRREFAEQQSVPTPMTHWLVVAAIVLTLLGSIVYFKSWQPSNIVTLPFALLEPQYQLFITATPSEAHIQILDMAPHYQPGLRLPPGRYQIEASAPGYETQTQWVEMVNQNMRVTLTLERKVWRESATGMEFVWIPRGTFMMGSPQDEEGRHTDEEPLHPVAIDDFWLAKHEVTNAQYRLFDAAHDSGEYGGLSLNGDDQPVVQVHWHQANNYALWLSQKGLGTFRLPTEAQWEYAVRAGTSWPRYWGNEIATTCTYANVLTPSSEKQFTFSQGAFPCEEPYRVTAPVGQFQANAFDLHDMLGNVWEWTCSRWTTRYDGSEQKCAERDADHADRVYRGGSWINIPPYVRSAIRKRYSPDSRDISLGFRLMKKI